MEPEIYTTFENAKDPIFEYPTHPHGEMWYLISGNLIAKGKLIPVYEFVFGSDCLNAYENFKTFNNFNEFSFWHQMTIPEIMFNDNMIELFHTYKKDNILPKTAKLLKIKELTQKRILMLSD